MKKCAIITFSQAINFGAVLQMYALQKFISDMGCKCEVLDYRSAELEKLYKSRTLMDWFNIKMVYHTFLDNSYIKYNQEGFKRFIHNNVTLSKTAFFSSEDLKRVNNSYDFFITGSDQVFNMYCNFFDDAYFLSFVNDSLKKNSYAASIGLEEIPQELKKKYFMLLNNFNNISIREKTGKMIVESLLNRKCYTHIDPTLLLSKEKWEAVSQKPHTNKRYVLVYVLSEDKELFQYAQQIAEEKDAEVLYINDRLFPKCKMKNLRAVSPEEWIGLFLNAEAIVTNSFHGVVFSINFEKEFYPFLLKVNQRVNSRIVDFLSLMELDDRIVHSPNLKRNRNLDIDYKKVKEKLTIERKLAYEYLDKIIAKA